MSEMGEDFKAWDKIKQAKKKSNKEFSTKRLQNSGIEFESRNEGVHLIVHGEGTELIDFWPSTGLWRPRGGLSSRGVQRLINHVKGAIK